MNECIFSAGVLLLRLGLGGAMLLHGVQKFKLILNGGAEKWLDPIGIGAANSLYLATFAELVCSALVILGLFTRTASAFISIIMFVAAFVFLKNAPWADRELAAVFLFGFIALAVLGGGNYSLSNLIFGTNSLLVNL